MTDPKQLLLAKSADVLVEQMFPRVGEQPRWAGFLFIEDAAIDWSTKSASVLALRTLDEFAERFSLLVAERSWVKLAAEGVWNDRLVVVVSAAATPRNPAAADVPNLLYSGLTNRVAADAEWNVEHSFRLVNP
jgi:hypothetical protein